MAKSLSQDDPKFLPTEMGVTEHKLRQLRKKYDPKNLPTVVEKGDAGYQQAHSMAMDIMRVRTGIESKRKELKRDALDWGKKVDGEAKRLTGLVEEIEAPWRKLKDDADAEAERIEREAREAEDRAIALIESKVRTLMVAAEGLLNADSAFIEKRLKRIKAEVITEDEYGSLYDAAAMYHTKAVKDLEEALQTRIDHEAARVKWQQEQDQLKRERLAIARERAEMEAERRADQQRNAVVPTPTTDPSRDSDTRDSGDIAPDNVEQAQEATLMEVTTPKDDFHLWWDQVGSHLALTKNAQELAEAAWYAGKHVPTACEPVKQNG